MVNREDRERRPEFLAFPFKQITISCPISRQQHQHSRTPAARREVEKTIILDRRR